MAGLTAARALHDAGLRVQVLEKSRGLGGRLATRRTRDGLTFDHGAQFAKAREEGFTAYLEAARAAGSAGDWVQDDGSVLPVGTPGMRDLVGPLAEGLAVAFDTTAATIARDGHNWLVALAEDAKTVRARAVVLAVPAPQAALLCRDVDGELAQALGAVEMDPCLAAMVAFEERLASGRSLYRDPTPELQWLSRESAKPDRPPGPDRWVIHGAPGWSHGLLEQGKDDIAVALLSLARAVWEADGVTVPPPLRLIGHRWRYARTRTALGRPFAAGGDGTLLAGGDWALGPRVEAAFRSGSAMANALLKRLPAT